MEYSKKILKEIYKFRQIDGYTSQAISIKIKKQHPEIKRTIDELKNDIVKIFGPKKKSKPYTEYQIKLLIRFYQSNVEIKNAIKYFNTKFNKSITNAGIRSMMSTLGIKRINKTKSPRIIVTPKDEVKIIKEYLNGKTGVELAKEYGFKKPKSIYDILKEHNINRRNPYIERSNNVTYADFDFKIINNKFKAYFLGFLITDGYVTESNNSVSLQIGDKDVIDFFANELNLNVVTIIKKNPNCIPLYRISIYGKERIKQLQRFGIIPRKSLTTPGFNLLNEEKQYIPYILRGMLDGDGWIRKDGKEFFLSTASKQLAEWSLKAFNDIGMENLKIKYISNEYNGIYLIRSALQKNIKILKEIIYDIPYGMERKYIRLH